MTDDVRRAIERLYLVFERGGIDDLTEVGCFDFGPSETELQGISRGVREIPGNVVASMEFFGEGWDSWGSKEEVKHFLPRILEFLAEDIGRLESPALFSLFKFKLVDCLRPEHPDWSVEEQSAIEAFADALLDHHFRHSPELGMLIEFACAIGVDPIAIAARWDAENALLLGQWHRCCRHFGVASKGDSPIGLYFDGQAELEAVLRSFLENMTSNENAEAHLREGGCPWRWGCPWGC